MPCGRAVPSGLDESAAVMYSDIPGPRRSCVQNGKEHPERVSERWSNPRRVSKPVSLDLGLARSPF